MFQHHRIPLEGSAINGYQHQDYSSNDRFTHGEDGRLQPVDDCAMIFHDFLFLRFVRFIGRFPQPHQEFLVRCCGWTGITRGVQHGDIAILGVVGAVGVIRDAHFREVFEKVVTLISRPVFRSEKEEQ